MENWQDITNINQFDTPIFAVYQDRLKTNIELALALVSGDRDRFRPHIKTHKTGEILQLFLDYGIYKIKCATIAEAELAAVNGITDVLLAYQPVGSKVNRLIKLIETFPEVQFSCIVDDLSAAQYIADQALEHGTVVHVYIDLNTGMNRTGFPLTGSLNGFCTALGQIKGLKLKGFHIYDGHLHDPDPEIRVQDAVKAMMQVRTIKNDLAELVNLAGLKIVAGGSNTFTYYAGLEDVECSPGTFVFWDINYTRALPELPFKPGALLISTVISIPSEDLICIDLGYKSVSSENPIEKRVIFPWNEDLTPFGQSEEHLTLKHTGARKYKVGDRIYGIPFHVCPTCALYEEVQVVNDHQITGSWKVLARDKKISI